MLLSITKLQNLKAIHNLVSAKKERNGCCQSQNYKIWKQFTTEEGYNAEKDKLLSITKLQNLKAIHNGNAQNKKKSLVVVNHKTTKFESNSQRSKVYILSAACCCQSQNYKIWKQFTTGKLCTYTGATLLSITKLQNLKAIHNVSPPLNQSHIVVVNHKTTKFESNSQQFL